MKGQVDILVVEEHPLVESPRRLEGRPAEQGRPTGWAERWWGPIKSVDGLAVQVVEGHQGVGPHRDAGRVNHLRGVRPDQDARHRLDSGLGRIEQGREKAVKTAHVVVEEDQGVAGAGCDRAIQGSPEAQIRAHPEHFDGGEAIGDHRR